MFGRIVLRTFAEVAPKAAAAPTSAAPAVEDPIKKLFIAKLKDYAAKKPKDFDAKQLAEALKKKN